MLELNVDTRNLQRELLVLRRRKLPRFRTSLIQRVMEQAVDATRDRTPVETGEAREMHHFAMLAGYGAEAINPYLAFEALAALHAEGEYPPEVSAEEVVYRYIKSVGKGLLKVMSKMGISTYQSYCGAQIFDAIGLNSDFVRKYFFGTATSIEGVGLKEVAAETVSRHADAFGDDAVLRKALDVGGEYAYRIRGEAHMWTPDAIAKLQHSTRANSYATYKEYSRLINEQSEKAITLRSLLDFKKGNPIPIEEVESKESIFRRFATGAMSFGSISYEAHSTLAVAMNRIGGKSNCGEGGEDDDLGVRREAHDLRDRRKRIAGHAEVEEQHVELSRTPEFQRIICRTAGTHNLVAGVVSEQPG